MYFRIFIYLSMFSRIIDLNNIFEKRFCECEDEVK